MGSYRKPKLIGLVGVNGSGKTYYLLQLLKARKRNLIVPSSVLDDTYYKAGIEAIDVVFDDAPVGKRRVVDIPGLNTFEGNKMINMYPFESDEEEHSLMEYILSSRHGFVSGGLVIDDFKTYFPSDSTQPRMFKKFFIDYRFKEVDLFIAAHSMQDINYILIKHGVMFVIFHTTLPPTQSFYKKLADKNKATELNLIMQRVNKTATDGAQEVAEYMRQNNLTEDQEGQCPPDMLNRKYHKELFTT